MSKSKKGFTLVELIAVMAIMAIATALVLPNIQGMIKKTEESKLKNYCVEATSILRSYVTMMTMGEEKVAYEESGAQKYYTIKDNPSGLQKALNFYNQNPAYQYYVVSYAEGTCGKNPTSGLETELTKSEKESGLKKNVDVMIACVEESKGKYTLKGFWFYSVAQTEIVYFYYVTTRRCGQGYSKLTSNGK